MTQYRREIQRSLLFHVKTVHLSGPLVFIYLFLEHFIYASIVWLFSVFFFNVRLLADFLISRVSFYQLFTAVCLALRLWFSGFMIWAGVSVMGEGSG